MLNIRQQLHDKSEDFYSEPQKNLVSSQVETAKGHDKKIVFTCTCNFVALSHNQSNFLPLTGTSKLPLYLLHLQLRLILCFHAYPASELSYDRLISCNIDSSASSALLSIKRVR